MFYRITLPLSFFLIISHLTGLSQDTLARKMEYSAYYTHGFLIAHRPLVVPLQQNKLNGVEITASWQADGSKQWHHIYAFPKTGISFSMWDPGNKDQLGTSYSLIPYVDFPLNHSERSKLYLKFGWGLGYVEKPFDADENYKNVAVGSKMNFSLILQPHYEFRISRTLSFNTGLSIVHYSNGSVSTPNLGLNLIGVTAGLGLNLGNPVLTKEVKLDEFKKSSRYTFFAAGAVKQIYPADGKSYFAGTLSANRSWQVTRKSAFGAGADIFYDNAIYDKLRQKGKEADSDLDAIKAGVHVSYEMMLSRVSLVVNMGGYLYSKYFDGNFYHRFGLRYSINDNLFACVSIKSHWGKADFAEIGVGYRLIK